MLRSKSRSKSVDVRDKSHFSSVFSRTLSASKFCRGDSLGAQIESKAVKSVGKNPFKVSRSSENRIDVVVSMQQQIGEMEEELRRTKEKLSTSEVEKHSVLDQLREANMRVNEALSPKKAEELMVELENLNKSLSDSQDELRTRDRKISSLELELEKSNNLQVALAEKNASVDKLNNELRDLREREKNMMVLLSENKGMIQELETEVQRKMQSEFRVADALAVQTKQFEALEFELQESKIENTSLREKIEVLEALSRQNRIADDGNSGEEEMRNLRSELQLAQEGEKKASVRAQSLVNEMELLRREWKQAIEAEEKSRKAMEDLALALKEVATEAKQAKEKLGVTETELEHVKGEAEQSKEMVRSTEERYANLLNEARKEAELQKNIADRLTLEADEALLAWNGKEMGFVSCIKKAEEERAVALHESSKLAESLKAAENMTRAAREETYKSRDILKQAINEANAANAAAGIAREENSQLKDCLAEKEEALLFLAKENERLRISEAAALENVKHFKRMLSASSTGLKIDDKELNGKVEFEDMVDEEQEENKKSISKTFSFKPEDLKFMNEPEDVHEKVLDEDPEKAEALKGSIFDANSETPKSEPHTPKRAFSGPRRHSFSVTENGGTPNSGALYHSDSAHDDSFADKPSHRRVRTMFRRVGDLLTMGKTFHRKEQSSVE